jgi:ribonuclease III
VTPGVPLRRTALEKSLGVRFGNEELYSRAFIHRSYAYENGGLPTNERLEFLGDAVLGLVITDMIYRAFPDLTEGQLAKLRAATVNMNVLADVARELGIGDVVRLGHGEQLSGGRDKSSILADTLEALLGAVYLDRGLNTARDLIERLFRPRMLRYARGEGDRDYKTILQELASAQMRALPEYRITERGPDHEKEFSATVYLTAKAWGTGVGRSKKEAEQQAAHEAYVRLTERPVADAASGGTEPARKGA